MTDKSWKAFERRVATILGGRRNPVTGERAGADVETDRLAVQCKKGRRLPAYLREWLDGITAWTAQHAPDKTPVVVWQAWRHTDQQSLVILTLDHFEALIHPQETDHEVAG